MENAIGMQLSFDTRSEGPLVDGNNSVKSKTVKRPSIVDWYRILRAHHQWTIFQAIRFALWLTR